MSKGLERVRQLMSEIESIQKVRVAPTPLKDPVPSREGEESAPTWRALRPVPPAREGKLSLSLTESVTVELSLPTGEAVKIRRFAKSVEIEFADGKAFHIPFANMA